MAVMLYHGDCIDVLATLTDNSIDAVVTDPPYDLVSINKRFGKEGSAPAQYGTDGAFGRLSKGFMGKAWDGTGIAFRADLWAAVLRVLKPGGHLLATGGDRTIHRMICAIEDAGFEIRNQLVWLHGQGFPKNMDISKQIDKMAGAEREVVGTKVGQPGYSLALDKGRNTYSADGRNSDVECTITAPATPAAQQWQGWGTALKPGMELVCLARKPLSESTVAANILKWGTGGLNIDAGRIAHDEPPGQPSDGLHGKSSGIMRQTVMRHRETTSASTQGRWPANVLLDEAAAELLDQQSGITRGASRFFYTAKASRSERNAGCDGNTHPTVKPLSLMRYLIRLITPSGGVVLDPFMGSGSTGVAALDCGFKFVGIEYEAEYFAIADARCYAADALPLERMVDK